MAAPSAIASAEDEASQRGAARCAGSPHRQRPRAAEHDLQRRSDGRNVGCTTTCARIAFTARLTRHRPRGRLQQSRERGARGRPPPTAEQRPAWHRAERRHARQRHSQGQPPRRTFSPALERRRRRHRHARGRTPGCGASSGSIAAMSTGASSASSRADSAAVVAVARRRTRREAP